MRRPHFEAITFAPATKHPSGNVAEALPNLRGGDVVRGVEHRQTPMLVVLPASYRVRIKLYRKGFVVANSRRIRSDSQGK